jgi:hypothetical protein
MSCSKHFLGFNWRHHDWHRHVTYGTVVDTVLTDMWGREVHADHVVCHTEYVCGDCGKVKVDRECTCERECGDRCAIRLDWIASQKPIEATPTGR